MKRIVRLNERDLTRIVKRVINENKEYHEEEITTPEAPDVIALGESPRWTIKPKHSDIGVYAFVEETEKGLVLYKGLSIGAYFTPTKIDSIEDGLLLAQEEHDKRQKRYKEREGKPFKGFEW
jgi:hypothetical protein